MWMDGWMVGHMDMCLPKFFGWMDYQIFLGVLSSTIIVVVYQSYCSLQHS